jgi:hypothetical protein
VSSVNDTIAGFGACLWRVIWLWLPVPILIWWWKTHPPIFQSGPYEGALNWPIFCIYFLCCSIQFGRFMWSWMKG